MPTVLVGEDETLIRELVAEELEEAGYSVVTAHNAHQAIAILEARQDKQGYIRAGFKYGKRLIGIDGFYRTKPRVFDDIHGAHAHFVVDDENVRHLGYIFGHRAIFLLA
jgi:CheY-like chemotaxis protein